MDQNNVRSTEINPQSEYVSVNPIETADAHQDSADRSCLPVVPAISLRKDSHGGEKQKLGQDFRLGNARIPDLGWIDGQQQRCQQGAFSPDQPFCKRIKGNQGQNRDQGVDPHGAVHTGQRKANGQYAGKHRQKLRNDLAGIPGKATLKGGIKARVSVANHVLKPFVIFTEIIIMDIQSAALIDVSSLYGIDAGIPPADKIFRGKKHIKEQGRQTDQKKDQMVPIRFLPKEGSIAYRFLPPTRADSGIAAGLFSAPPVRHPGKEQSQAKQCSGDRQYQI